MIRVTTTQINTYRKRLKQAETGAVTYLDEFLKLLQEDNPGASLSELLTAARSEILNTVSMFGDQAAEAALDMLTSLAERAGIRVETLLEDVLDTGMADASMNRALAHAAGDPVAFRRNMTPLVTMWVHRIGQENMIRNCQRNDIAYARVPSGASTCGFCFMLASRGFVYKSQEKAGSSHPFHKNCDCIVMPGFGGKSSHKIQVEGYDPESMYQTYLDAVERLGGDQGMMDSWKQLKKGETPESRRRIAQLRSSGRTEYGVFKHYMQQEIQTELEKTLNNK